MRSIVIFTQSLALLGTVAALAETQVQQNFVTQKIQGSMKRMTEAEVFNRPSLEMKSTTPEQKATAEKKMKEVQNFRSTQPEKKNLHPDLVLNKDGPLTETEQNHLRRARTAAIQDARAHQVHTDESE